MTHGLSKYHTGRPREHIGKRTYVAAQESLKVTTRAGKTYHLVLWRDYPSQVRQLAKDMKFAEPGHATIIRPIRFQLQDMAVDHAIFCYGLYARKV